MPFVIEVSQYFEGEFVSWTIKRLSEKEVKLLDKLLTSVLGYTPLKELNKIVIEVESTEDEADGKRV
jgi:uncharacterized protein Yka (UPF0111/DUF47 family)